MFEEDEQGDLLLASELTKSEVKTVTGEAAAKILASNIANVLGSIEPVTVPKADRVKTLREMLHDNEPWNSAVGGDATKLSPGIRRLQERRVNRILETVANWMLTAAEERLGDEMTLAVLLELAERVRQEITWPERLAHQALTELAMEAQELES